MELKNSNWKYHSVAFDLKESCRFDLLYPFPKHKTLFEEVDTYIFLSLDWALEDL